MKNFKQIELALTQKVQFLELFDLIDTLNSMQIAKLATYFQTYSIPSQTKILSEGEINNFFCLIAAGHIDIVKSDIMEKEKNVASYGAGKIVGEISFFDRSVCSASVIAKSDATLLIMNQNSFKLLCDDAPLVALQITLKILRNLSQKLRQTTGKLVDLL